MYQYVPKYQNGTVIPKYRFDKQQTDATLHALNVNTCRIVELCKAGRTELEKEKIIHDYLSDTVLYDGNSEIHPMNV